VEASATRGTTALVYQRTTGGLQVRTVRLTSVRRTGLTVSRGVGRSPQVSQKWSQAKDIPVTLNR
jgi:hypothetical protein